MRKITKIQVQKNNKSRVNLYLDGEYAFPLSIESILQNKLEKGKKLNEAQIEKYLSESELEKLTNKVIKFISYRPRSRQEIIDRLYKYTKDYKEKREKLIQLVLKEIEKKNLINDLEFAIWFVQQRQAHRPRSKRKLYSELLTKGLDKKTIQKSLKDTEFNELKQLKKLLNKYLKRKSTQKELPNQISKKLKNKLIKYLLRKGFSYNLIKQAIKDYHEQQS